MALPIIDVDLGGWLMQAEEINNLNDEISKFKEKEWKRRKKKADYMTGY